MEHAQCSGGGGGWGVWSVEVEAFLHGGSEQPLPHDVLGGIFRKLQVVDAGVDRRVAGVCGVHLRSKNQSELQPGHTHTREGVYGGGSDLPHDGEARVQVGQSARGQRGAASSKLQEGFPLVRRHSAQNSDEAQEAGTETGQQRGQVSGTGHIHNASIKETRPPCVIHNFSEEMWP